MSVRLEMLQAARRAPKVLDGSVGLVEAFLRSQQNEDGGFRGRADRSDLYYTVFAIDGLLALGAGMPVEKTAGFLRSFGGGQNLDLVNLSCLVRCWAGLEQAAGSALQTSDAKRTITSLIESHRAGNGYTQIPGCGRATAYGSFLAWCAYQDLGLPMPGPLALAAALADLETRDGAFANDPASRIGSTNATAAAVAVLRGLNLSIPPKVGPWLLARCHAQGGFLANPLAPMPDLLSTATSLHALAVMGVSLANVREKCLDFIDSLWTNRGGFHGTWADERLDCEYTYYGLLALGHLG